MVKVGNGGCIIGVTHHSLPRLQTKGQVVARVRLGKLLGTQTLDLQVEAREGAPS